MTLLPTFALGMLVFHVGRVKLAVVRVRFKAFDLFPYFERVKKMLICYGIILVLVLIFCHTCENEKRFLIPCYY